MKREYDFSKGVRGKFYNKDIRIKNPKEKEIPIISIGYKCNCGCCDCVISGRTEMEYRINYLNHLRECSLYQKILLMGTKEGDDWGGLTYGELADKYNLTSEELDRFHKLASKKPKKNKKKVDE